LRKSYRQQRVFHPVRHRVSLAAYLALVFTPSIITDFWLFMIPGPALVGFTLLLPGLLFSEHRSVILQATAVYHVFPMLGGFAVFYILLWTCGRLRRNPSN
jgi:hypothetical protein